MLSASYKVYITIRSDNFMLCQTEERRQKLISHLATEYQDRANQFSRAERLAE